MSEPLPQGEEINGSITKHMDKRFINSFDLLGLDDVTVTIKRVELHKNIEFQNKKKETNVKMIYFEESEKPLVIRDVHIKALVIALATAKVKNWKGRKVKMYAEKGCWFGKEGYAVRFRTQEVIAA